MTIRNGDKLDVNYDKEKIKMIPKLFGLYSGKPGVASLKTEDTEEGGGLSHIWCLLLGIVLAWNLQKLKLG